MRPAIRLSDFTHRVQLPDGWYLLFKAGRCDRCGGLVQEPNSLKVRPTDATVLKPLVAIEQVPPEIWCTEDGETYCDHCAGDRLVLRGGESCER